MKKIIDLHQVDAFTDTLFGGNPAGVVTNADGLTDKQMLFLAREMNLSETAFVSKPTKKDADFRLRWFTPETEVDFCGHATIGTLFELTRLKLYGLGGKGQSSVRVETQSGVLPMWSSVEKGVISATFTAPTPKIKEYYLQDKDFAKTLGIPHNAILSGAKVMLDTTLNDIHIPISSLALLQSLSFNFDYIREQFKKENIIAFSLFTLHNNQVFLRGLAPLVGVDEDPFTGRLQAGLFESAKYNKIVDQKQTRLITNQGQSLNRPGQAVITLESDGTTRVTGRGTHVFSTELSL